MGISRQRHANSQGSMMKLPDPLPAGAEPRTAEDGTRLWNPNWSQNSTDLLNTAFLNAIADRVLELESVSGQLYMLEKK
jgi:hypothetical protein